MSRDRMFENTRPWRTALAFGAGLALAAIAMGGIGYVLGGWLP